jgi:hypothetical protein
MLGIGHPDRHALPRITPSKRADHDPFSLPRERVRSSTLTGRSLPLAGTPAHSPNWPLPEASPDVGSGSI